MSLYGTKPIPTVDLSPPCSFVPIEKACLFGCLAYFGCSVDLVRDPEKGKSNGHPKSEGHLGSSCPALSCYGCAAAMSRVLFDDPACGHDLVSG